LVRVSHILIAPKDGSQGADRAARARADSVLARLRAGADFAATARAVSDDEATRDEGGDLGSFGRGAMLEDFERVAFSMRPGDLSNVVHTSVGYHILQCHEYVPAFIQPLAQIYSNVSSDLANDKADSVAARRADSLYRAYRTPAQARAAIRRAGLLMLAQTRVLGERAVNPELEEFFERLDRVKPGELYPGARKERVGGWSIAWVDSISAPEAPTWENARAEAMQRYQSGAGQRALDAKRAELDSMVASGWSVDSLATLWGGLEHLKDAPSGAALPGLGQADLDSLVLGRGGRAPVLKTGVMSSWIPFPLGEARVRVVNREAPDPEQVAARVEGERRMETERNLSAYYQTLKARYPVKILDTKLRAVMLPEIPGTPR